MDARGNNRRLVIVVWSVDLGCSPAWLAAGAAAVTSAARCTNTIKVLQYPDDYSAHFIST